MWEARSATQDYRLQIKYAMNDVRSQSTYNKHVGTVDLLQSTVYIPYFFE